MSEEGYDFFLMDNTRLCLPVDGNEPVERLKIIIHGEQNPREGGASADAQKRTLQHFGGEMVFELGSGMKWRGMCRCLGGNLFKR